MSVVLHEKNDICSALLAGDWKLLNGMGRGQGGSSLDLLENLQVRGIFPGW
jgi:hypothetical protein